MVATSSNRRQFAGVLESTLGTTPVTPRMRQRLVVGDSLNYGPTFVDSGEMRSDRTTSDSVVVGLDSNGAINWEFHYPYPESWLDWDIRSAFYNNWVKTTERDNDGTAASIITAVSAGAMTCTATGTTFSIGHLVRTTGFAVAANNTTNVRITTAGTTAITAAASGWTTEASPAAAARVKVIGAQGASADITATATGLTCTALNFVTMGLVVGQWIKIGGALAANRFTAAGAANNARVRVTSVSATVLGLDNLPTGWAADPGTGKLISIYFGDRIVNGITQVSQTIEIGDLGQTTPNYLVKPGMVASQLQLSAKPKQIITGSTTFMGMTGSNSTTTLDASIDAAPPQNTFPQFAGSANVGRVAEFGTQLSTPNWCIGLDITIANNIDAVEALDAVGPQDLVGCECLVTGTLATIYGDTTTLARYLAGTPTSINISMSKLSQMVFITIPRVALISDGNPQTPSKNQIVDVSFGFRASRDDALTGNVISMDRLEYTE